MITFLTRTQAAKYLSERGISVSTKTLNKLGWLGNGPRYALIRGRAVYRPDDLDAWLTVQFEHNVRSV